MDPLYRFYLTHSGLIDASTCLAVFLGIAGLAFWRKSTGFRVTGPLVLGLTLLLTISLIWWAGEHNYRMIDLGPAAVFILVEALVITIINLAVRSR